MKKLILTLAVTASIISCKKDGATDNVSATENVELNQQELDASYAFGVSLGQRTEQYNANPMLEGDSLNYSEVEKGLNDYLKEPDGKDSYYYGIELGKQVKGALNNDMIKGHLSQEQIVQGMMDYLNKKNLRVSADSVSFVMQDFYQGRLNAKSQDNAKAGLNFLNKIKKEDGVQTTPSGLAYKVIQEGNGAKVEIGDKVSVKYTGKTIDGEVFDSTDTNNDGNPVEMPIMEGGLIPGWIEGMQLMSKGGKYTLYIPSELGYGNNPSGKIEPGETLIFDIEVIDIVKGGAK